MSYLSDVIADAPIHYWRCADPGGNRFADVGTDRNDALVRGSPFGAAPYTGPNSDGGAMFGGLGLVARAEQGIAHASAGWSFECIAWLGNNGTQAPFLHMLDNYFGDLYLQQGNTDGSSFTLTGSTHNPSLGAGFTRQHWHHIVVTVDAANITCYSDAVAAGTFASSATAGYLGGTHIGGDRNATGSGSAFVSEVAVYLTTLSPARVTAHYLAIDALLSQPVFKTPTTGDTSGILAAVTAQFPTLP